MQDVYKRQPIGQFGSSVTVFSALIFCSKQPFGPSPIDCLTASRLSLKFLDFIPLIKNYYKKAIPLVFIILKCYINLVAWGQVPIEKQTMNHIGSKDRSGVDDDGK